MFNVPNKYREKKHPQLKFKDEDGNNGFFIIPHYRIDNYRICIQASDGMGWEHVSVSILGNKKSPNRCPTWDEMCWVKNFFWGKDDCVVQYHPAETEYVNMHQFVLHLWRPVNQAFPIPLKEMVGINL